jgi:sortase (surface protein transpeptidase)
VSGVVALGAIIMASCAAPSDDLASNPTPESVEASGQGTVPGPATSPEPSTAAESARIQAPPPTRVRIPAIGVEADSVPLGLRDDGSIEVPSDFDTTGWWADGPEPGEVGPAVLLGHVDSRAGPAVFFELKSLQPGDQIHIDRTDGTTVTYRVERLEQHPKDAFPTDAVYGPTDQPELRLVTCGGDFDREVRSYRDNVIVYASLLPSP